jgi:galactose mutarotase-like enzyme
MTSPFLAIASPALSAEIDPLGAQLSILRDADGRDLLWDGDPAIWNGRAPILFPIVGALVDGRYRLGANSYSLPKHGFARRSRFEIVEHLPASILFRLNADEETLAVYPFRFQLDIRFGIEGATLTLAAIVRNLGEDQMPASFGFHPALRWPLPYGQARAEHFIRFGDDEPAPIRRVDTDGVVRPRTYPTPVVGRDLPLRDSYFEDDALIFDPIKSQRLRYGAPNGPHIDVEFPDTPYLGVWTKPNAPYICIEPWHGIADPAGFQGDFRQKPGVFEVAAGQARRIAMSITLKP